MSMSPSDLFPSGFPPNPTYIPLSSHGCYMPLFLFNIYRIWWTYNTILVCTIMIIIVCLYLYIEDFAFWSIQSYMGKKNYPR
jgi:hypothetical protein